MLFLFVHPGVGPVEDGLVRSIASLVVDGHAYRSGELRPRLSGFQIADAFESLDFLEQSVPVIVVLAFEDDDEFVAADAVNRTVLVKAADGPTQSLQSDVPFFMTKAVVDFLELVQIDHDYGKGSLAGGDFLIQVVYLLIVSGNVLHRRQFILIGLFLHGANVVSHPFHRIVHVAGQAADFIVTGIGQMLVVFPAAQAAGSCADILQRTDDAVGRLHS